jgi:hypothetical protein
MKEDYPLFVHWLSALDWILDTAERFPKSVRFSLAGRIADLSLDVMEGIVEAIYSKQRRHILDRCNLYIEKLRVLFRISHRRRYISMGQYEHVSGLLDEAGRMIGGWRKA